MSYLFGGTPFDGYDAGGRRSLNGGGSGGGGQQQSTQTSYQTNIPEYLQGPAERSVARGETLSEQGYTPYTGERIAGFTPQQQAAFAELGGLGTPGEFDQAGNAITGAQQFGTIGALGALGYGSQAISPEQLQYFQQSNAPVWNSSVQSQYTSPYQQAVTDIAKREATTDAAKLNAELSSRAAKAGAFGGSRFGIEQALLGSKLATNLSDIQTKGLQSAYENAQTQFERDRAAQQAVNAANLQAALGVQSLGAGQSLEAQKVNEANRLNAANLNLQGAQFGTKTGLESASALQGLGTAGQSADLSRIAAQQAAGAQIQANEQQKLDTAYQQAIEQRDWEKNQLGWLSGLIRGTPYSTNQLQSVSTPGASTASQLASLGLGAYGLSSLLGKKDGGAIKMAKGGDVKGYAPGGEIDSRITAVPDQIIDAVVAGRSNALPVDVALQEQKRRKMLRTGFAGKQALEEIARASEQEAGLGALPAENMEFAASGGIMDSGDDEDEVERFAEGKMVSYTDPVTGETYMQPEGGFSQSWLSMFPSWGAQNPDVQRERQSYGLPAYSELQDKNKKQAAPTDAAKKTEAAPAASKSDKTSSRPPKAPAPAAAAPAAEPELGFYQKLYRENLMKADTTSEELAKQLAKQQENIAGMRSDIKGIAALKAAAALSQGGPGGTIAQFGRGLGAIGDEAGRGVNQIQAAEQGLLGQNVQLAKLRQDAENRRLQGLAEGEKLGLIAPLYGAQTKQALANAEYLGRRDGGGGSNGLAELRFRASGLEKEIKAMGIPTSAGDKLRLDALKREYANLIRMGGGSGYGTDTLPKGAVVAN